MRLLVADGDGAGARVRIVHEALLSHWPRAKQQIGQDYQDFAVEEPPDQAAALAGSRQEEAKDPLLPGGFQLQEGSGLLKRWASWGTGSGDRGFCEGVYGGAPLAARGNRRWRASCWF